MAETGAPPNSGRISVVDAAGRVQPLLEGLPSGPAAPDGALHTRLPQVMILEDGRWRIAAYHNVAVSPAAAGQ